MKTLIRRVLNLLLYLSFCAMAGTGLLMAFRLVPGSRGGRGLTVLGWTRHEWGDLHTWISYLFIALVLTHLAINWQWLVKVAGSGRIWRVAIGLAVGIAIVSAFLLLPIKERARGRGMRRQFTPLLTGSAGAGIGISKGSPDFRGRLGFHSHFDSKTPERERRSLLKESR